MFKYGSSLVSRAPVDGALLVFDIDGVLIDPNRSFHEAVSRTLEALAPGLRWTDEHFQAFKRLGGFNNDFRLAAAAVALWERGLPGDDWQPQAALLERLDDRIEELEPSVQQHVQAHYSETKALERPSASASELESLPAHLAILTGRPPEELELAFDVLGFSLPAVCDSAPQYRKPQPLGLLELAGHYSARRVVFVGDTLDDALCLQAARQKDPAISWVFAGVGPDRHGFLQADDLQADGLADLLPILKHREFWAE